MKQTPANHIRKLRTQRRVTAGPDGCELSTIDMQRQVGITSL